MNMDLSQFGKKKALVKDEPKKAGRKPIDESQKAKHRVVVYLTDEELERFEESKPIGAKNATYMKQILLKEGII